MVAKFDVIIFDLDQTLVSIEGLSYLAESISQKRLPLLEASLNGKLSLQQAFLEELSQFSPSYTDMLRLGLMYQNTLIDDAVEVIDALHLLGKEIWLITNTFHPAVDVVGNRLKIPHERILGLDMVFDANGRYRGFDHANPLIKNGGKAEMVKRYIHPKVRVAFVGDSVPDLETKPVVDLFIGYGGVVSRPVVKQQAHIFVNSKRLSALLPILLENDEIDLLRRNNASLLQATP